MKHEELVRNLYDRNLELNTDLENLLIEEMAEYIKEVSKEKRGIGKVFAKYEELVDVMIVISQVALLYGSDMIDDMLRDKGNKALKKLRGE